MPIVFKTDNAGNYLNSLYDLSPTENNPLILPSGRKIYRHSTLPGSVLMFNDGVDRSVLVLDAQFRIGTLDTSKKYGWFNTDVPNITEIDISDWYLNTLSGYPDNITDDTINNKMKDINTSRHNTDALLESGYPSYDLPEIAQYCRSIVIGNELACDLPTINILMRMFLDKKAIDNLDSTIIEYPTRSLTTIWTDSYIWSSSECSAITAWGVNYDSGVLPYTKSGTFRVAPVYEL